MLPTPVLSVSGKGFARLRISAWHFSPAPPILYAVRAIVYHKSRVLSRVLRDFSGGKAPGTPGAEPARHWLALPIRHPAGGVPSESPTRRKTDRTAFLLAVPAAKERGDRGRWNYPSQATAAFEMVLSPGAGRTSAAGVQPPPGAVNARRAGKAGAIPPQAPQRQGNPAARAGTPIPPPSAPPQPSPQGRRQAPPPEANAGKTQAPARQPFRQQRRGKIRSSTG